MIRRAVRLMIRLSLLVGAALVVSKVVQARREEQAGSKQPFGGGPSPVPPPTPGMVRSPAAAKPAAAKPAAAKPAAVKPAVVETEKVATAVTPPPEPASTSATTKASASSDDKVIVGRSQPPPAEPWVDPDVAGLCPSSHPVKAKLTSGIFHLPGMAAYARTRADRCYCDEATAEGDGLRKAKR